MKRFLLTIVAFAAAFSVARAASSSDVARIEAAIGWYPGMTKTFPQVQMSFRLERIEARGGNEYAVVVRRVY